MRSKFKKTMLIVWIVIISMWFYGLFLVLNNGLQSLSNRTITIIIITIPPIMFGIIQFFKLIRDKNLG